MTVRNPISKYLGGAVLAGLIGVGCVDAASAQTVTTSFSVHNSFSTAITLDTSSCSPSTSFFPPFSIASGTTANFSASTTGGTLLCTVRYQNGANGCQFKVEVADFGGTTGFVASNAYKGSGSSPHCTDDTGVTTTDKETGTFTMAP